MAPPFPYCSDVHAHDLNVFPQSVIDDTVKSRKSTAPAPVDLVMVSKMESVIVMSREDAEMPTISVESEVIREIFVLWQTNDL